MSPTAQFLWSHSMRSLQRSSILTCTVFISMRTMGLWMVILHLSPVDLHTVFVGFAIFLADIFFKVSENLIFKKLRKVQYWRFSLEWKRLFSGCHFFKMYENSEFKAEFNKNFFITHPCRQVSVFCSSSQTWKRVCPAQRGAALSWPWPLTSVGKTHEPNKNKRKFSY